MTQMPETWPSERLNVSFNGECCGALWQRQGRMVFDYHPDWCRRRKPKAISQSLPLRTDPYEGLVVEAFFANLLPEGDVRSRMSRALQLSERNDYALLEAIGGDCAGALSLEPPGVASVPSPRTGSTVLDREALAQLAAGLPMRPLLVGETGVRLSLAGAQAKLVLCKAGDEWIKPGHGQVSTHILKPPIRDFPDSVENEAFCMLLARECELGVPDCWIEHDPRLYVVERYDRKRNHIGGKVERLHQEDFCQALGVPASSKYQNEGGPGLKDCFDLIRRACTYPAGDLLRMLRWVIFNFLIGNHDGHAKNLSLLYVDGRTSLAPFYDLLCTAAYTGLDERFAMTIGGAKSLRYMAMHHWDGFADEAALNRRFVRSELSTLTGKILDGTKEVMHRVTPQLPETLNTIDVILKRVDALQKMRSAEESQIEISLDSSPKRPAGK